MRKIRVLMVIAALVAACVPAAAQAQVEAPAWGKASVGERVTDWFESLWRAVAGSETEPVPADDGDDLGDLVPGGPGVGESLENPLPETEVYPEFDPEG